MRRNKRYRLTDDMLASAVHAALERMGWTVPTALDAVAEAEAWLRDARGPVPEDLRSRIDAALAQDATPAPPCMVRSWTSDSVEETLARAAREGGAIAPEVEATMRRDREIAEAEFRRQSKGVASNEP